MDDDCRPARLAALLVRSGALLTVVGGTARWLSGDVRRPLDLDVTVVPGDLAALDRALARLGVEAHESALLRLRDVRVDTSWGPIDIFVRPAPPPSRTVALHGTLLRVVTA